MLLMDLLASAWSLRPATAAAAMFLAALICSFCASRQLADAQCRVSRHGTKRPSLCDDVATLLSKARLASMRACCETSGQGKRCKADAVMKHRPHQCFLRRSRSHQRDAHSRSCLGRLSGHDRIRISHFKQHSPAFLAALSGFHRGPQIPHIRVQALLLKRDRFDE